MNPLPFLLQTPGTDDLIDEGIRFGNLPPNYVAWFLVPLVVVLYALWVYRRERNATGPLRIVLPLLRIAALFFVIFLIYGPYRQFRKIDEIRSMVSILVDESASMDRHDPWDREPETAAALAKAARLSSSDSPSNFSRTDLLKRILGPDGLALVEKAREKHDVKVQGFASDHPRPLASLLDAVADGPVTATGDALGQVLADPEIQTKPNTSIILIGDGRTNTGGDPAEIARFAGQNDRVPIHVIGAGDPHAVRDIDLRFVRADEVVLARNTLKMELTIRQTGFDDDYGTITIKDQDGRPWLTAQSRKLPPEGQDEVTVLDVPVTQPVGTYTLEVTVNGPASEENTRNNSKRHVVTVKDDRLRVLYVDTLPRWEYRRLKNFLVRGEDAFDTQCLLLSAEQGFVQEHTQRAGSGIGSLRDFPTEFAELDKYDVLIFGDVDPSLLAPTPEKVRAALEAIKKFVDNGGGLAVIAGDGWTPLSYVDTPLEEILPVDITNAGDGSPLRNYVDEWKPKLTAIGRIHPVMQLRSNAEDNRKIWEQRGFGLKEFRWWYPVTKASPAAQVLAFHPDERNRYGNHPILVAGTYGDGPVFFSATDETWRWFYLAGPGDFNRFWGNVVRWLARSHLYRGSKRFKLVSDASEYRIGESIRLTAFVKTKSFEPATDPTWKVMVVPPESKSTVIDFQKTEDGQYEHTLKATKSGRYEAWIVGDEGIAGTRFAPISFEVNYVDPESQNPAMDEPALRKIAEASGGTYFSLADAGGIFDRLRADTTRQSSVVTRPLKSQGWLPLVLLALLTAEWILRKRFSMA